MGSEKINNEEIIAKEQWFGTTVDPNQIDDYAIFYKGKFELAIYLGKLRLNDKWYYITKPFDEDSSNPTMLKAWSVVSPVKTCRGPIKEEFGPVVTYTWEKIYGNYDAEEIM